MISSEKARPDKKGFIFPTLHLNTRLTHLESDHKVNDDPTHISDNLLRITLIPGTVPRPPIWYLYLSQNEHYVGSRSPSQPFFGCHATFPQKLRDIKKNGCEGDYTWGRDSREESLLATNNFSIFYIPVIITNCSPDAIVIYFHSSFAFLSSSNQPYASVCE